MIVEPVIGHLVEQRRDGVVAAVEDEQQRRNFGLPEVEQLVLLGDDLLKTQVDTLQVTSATAGERSALLGCR